MKQITNKRIALVGTSTETYFGVSLKYMTFAKRFGDVIILTPDNAYQEGIDLLILQGGSDIDPTSYGQIPAYGLSRINPYFEYFDKNILPEYVKHEIPIFGICRGLQAINVLFSGDLEQNIINHPTSKDESRDELVHEVVDLRNNKKFKVNSLHHQKIGRLGKDLKPLALYAPKNKENVVIEAIKHRKLPIYAVQWHCEEIYDSFSDNIIKDLLK